MGKMKLCLVLSVVAVSWFARARHVPSPLGCGRRVQVARAQQEDHKGRRCWDYVSVTSCAGRCDSREISHWEFPYKKSYHPVCVHGTRLPVTAVLRHCDAGTAPGTEIFNYVAADHCRCGVCSSENTSCEWLPPNSTLLHGPKDEDRLHESYDVNDVLRVMD